MNHPEGMLANNLKILRKNNNLSQEELASKLNIKRSNIAAYESKGVEPRLRIILEMARLFNISVGELIERKLESHSVYESFDSAIENPMPAKFKIDIQINKEINDFIDKSVKIKKILEGFKALYSFKKLDLDPQDHVKQKLIHDIDNFVDLIDKFMLHNEQVISNISNYKISQN